MDVSLIRLLAALIGSALFGIGAGIWWLPAGLMASGALLILAAVVGEVAAARANRQEPPPYGPPEPGDR